MSRRLSGLVAAAGVFTLALVAAPSARAGDVWLWVCEGPAGRPLAGLGDRAERIGDAGGTCPGGLTVSGTAAWAFDLPSGTALNRVQLDRTVALGPGQRYTLRADGALESAAEGTLSGPAAFAATGSRVVFETTCADVCETGGATLHALALRVSDVTAPTGAVSGWRSPAAGEVAMTVAGSDRGAGLRHATVYVDGVPVDAQPFGSQCPDLSVGAAVDLPYAAVGQDDDGVEPVGCLGRGTTTVKLDTTRFPDSVSDQDLRSVTVTVTDQAGNTSTVMQRGTEIRNLPEIDNTSRRELFVGAGFPGTPPLPGAPGGGVKNASESSAGACTRPELTMVLDQKPLRTSKGVVVLKRNRRYRFAGRLTCDVGGVRRSAPKRTPIEVRTTMGGKTRRSTVRTRGGGAVRATLKASRSGAIVFRYTHRGARSQVRIRFRVERSLPRSTSIYGHWLRYESPSDRVRFTALEARSVPKGAQVRVRCRGRVCPGGVGRRFSARRASRRLSLLSALGSRELAPGAILDVTITKSGHTGIGKVYCVRTRQRVQVRAYLVGGPRPVCGARGTAALAPPVRGAVRESG